ncbi:Na/Pi cotransporter family protein, partial [Vibrio parahaemolyticus]|nr:Na/Pi cotransporter family protein [Vibrio parahaemolyticus]
LREIPVKGAEMISEMAIKNKAVVGGYLMSVFVILPGAILALTT